MKLPQHIINLLRCPKCGSKLDIRQKEYQCTNSSCSSLFPKVDDVPVVINEANSVFSIQDFVQRRNTFFQVKPHRMKQFFNRYLPSLDHNIATKENYSTFTSLLLNESETPVVLIIGGSIIGKDLEVLLSRQNIQCVETDVSLGPRTMLICDAHDIPLENGTFDGVIVQAVLEHVVDPYRCVDEIHRVLKDRGIVYAETPFMQQVHGGRYDFTRFTHLGHRRLFRKFEELSSGAVDGPGMALAWSYRYFLLSFTQSKLLRSILSVVARLTGFWLKYFDYLLWKKPSALDASSGLFFLGRKSDKAMSDKDLITMYKGAFR